MKFSLPLAFNPISHWAPLARAAEAAGIDGLIVSDHLAYPKQLETPYPYTDDGNPLWEPSTDWPDPLIAIGALAAATERIRLITAVYLLPLRHPLLSAKLIATAERFAEGRIVLGVGTGWMRQEFDYVEVPFERRGARMDEALVVMKKLWAGDEQGHRGEFFELGPLDMNPKPSREIPIWGGGTADVALRRAATTMDGWVGQIQKTSDLVEYVPKLLAWRADSPLADAPFEICSAVEDAYTLDHYRALEELGVTELTTVPWYFYGNAGTGDLQKKCDGIMRFADEVIARQ